MASTGLEMAVSLRNTVGPLQRAHIHEGSQLPGGGSTEFRFDWTHAFGTIRIEVISGVVYVDGKPVQIGVPAMAGCSSLFTQG
jgi:hypothetical protein